MSLIKKINPNMLRGLILIFIIFILTLLVNLTAPDPALCSYMNLLLGFSCIAYLLSIVICFLFF